MGNRINKAGLFIRLIGASASLFGALLWCLVLFAYVGFSAGVLYGAAVTGFRWVMQYHGG